MALSNGSHRDGAAFATSELASAARSNSNDSTTPAAHSAGSSAQRQKRARSQLSCTPCRQGKLKCNRQHPACDQCIKRSRDSSCIYVPPPVKHRQPQNVKGRIRQLESMVVNLMHQNRVAQRSQPPTAASPSSLLPQLTPPSDGDTSPQSSGKIRPVQDSPPSDIDTATTPFGRMHISKDEITYVGDSHWGAILNSISDLRRDFDDDDGDDEPDDDLDINTSSASLLRTQTPHDYGMGFIVNAPVPMTRAQILKAVPDKKLTDRLLSLWFNSPDPFKPIIHGPTFQDEYRRFWRNPDQTPTMWLGLLFALMSLAASFSLRDADPASPQARKVLVDVSKYHQLSASAAVLAEFAKPKPYTLECLMLYAAGMRSESAFVQVWLTIGLAVRLALRMGYHRDPSHCKDLSPFEGEMRRRNWALITMMDTLISFQLGLPSMVKTIQSDTQAPRNLLDRDFSPSSKTLPPSRGVEDLTPMSYGRAKLTLVRVFADVSELSHDTVPASRDQIAQLDAQLEEAKATIPPLMQMPDLTEVVTDPAEQLMCRFNLDLLYLKTKLVLHRRHMQTPHEQLSPEEQRQGVGNSRLICGESALRVLRHHHTIYAATQPGGQLESVKWYMGSISTHDFLLAAMVLCLELNNQIESSIVDQNGVVRHPCPRRPEIMAALEQSHQIWSTASAGLRQSSMGHAKSNLESNNLLDETEKASRAMAVMMKKVRLRFGDAPPPPGGSCPLSGSGPLSMAELVPRTSGSSAPSAARGNSVSSTGLDYSSSVAETDWLNVDGFGSGVGGDAGTQRLGMGSSMPDLEPTAFATAWQPDASLLAPQPGADFPSADFAMTSEMLDAGADLDWRMWDQEMSKGPTEMGGSGDGSYFTGVTPEDASMAACTIGAGLGPESLGFDDVTMGQDTNDMIWGFAPGE